MNEFTTIKIDNDLLKIAGILLFIYLVLRTRQTPPQPALKIESLEQKESPGLNAIVEEPKTEPLPEQSKKEDLN